MVSLLLKTTQRCRELEGPKEVVSLLEMWSYCEDFMNQIFNADKPMLAQTLKIKTSILT